MKIQIIKGVVIDGHHVFPKVKPASGKGADVDTIVDVDKATAKMLVTGHQAKLAKPEDKITLELKKIEPEQGDDLDAIFGEDGDD